MHIEFLVEEDSARVALENLLPEIATRLEYKIHVFQGKLDLLGQLPKRLRGYRRWLPEDWRIVVLLDNDLDDCRELKACLEVIASEAGLATRSHKGTDGRYRVINRLVIKELESWFFGDAAAIHAAYPRLPSNISGWKRFRKPDAISGSVKTALLQVLHRAGYYRGIKHLPKGSGG